MHIRISGKRRVCSYCGVVILPGQHFGYWPTDGKGWIIFCPPCSEA